MTATLEATRTAPCLHCRELVFTVRGSAGQVLTLDAVPELGGMYAIDKHGQAHRRGLVELFNEQRGVGRTLGGYVAHECVRDVTYIGAR